MLLSLIVQRKQLGQKLDLNKTAKCKTHLLENEMSNTRMNIPVVLEALENIKPNIERGDFQGNLKPFKPFQSLSFIHLHYPQGIILRKTMQRKGL